MSNARTPAKPAAPAADPTRLVLDQIGVIGDKLTKLEVGLNEVREKAAQFVMPVVRGPLARPSDPYSYIRAAALAAGRLKPEQAKYEHAVATRMKGMYGARGVTFEGGHLVPSDTASVAYYAQEEDQDTLSAMTEMRLRVKAFDLGQVDPALRQKSIGSLANTQNTLSDADGGVLRGFPTLGDLIELQRNREVFSRLGAQEISLPPNGMMVLPKQTGGTVAYWANEAGTVAKSQTTNGKLELQAKKLFIWSQLTNEMIRFVSPQSEAMLRTDMAIQAGLAADSAFLYGASNDRPKGLLVAYPTAAEWVQGVDKLLLYTAGVTGADGDVLQFGDPDNMTALLPDAVRDQDGLKWLCNQKLWARLRTRRADQVTAGDAAGLPLFDITRSIADRRVQELNGYEVVQSSQIKLDRQKGASSNLGFLLQGYWPDWIIARLGVMEFLASNTSDTAMASDLTVVRGIQYVDAGARHAASFVACDNLKVQ